jgi:hypothetical protein
MVSCDASDTGTLRASAVSAECFSPSNRLATGTARPKERPSEHKVKDESNQIGYEESGNHPGPSRHLTPFCVAIDISEARKQAAVKTPNVKPNQSASGMVLRNPWEASRERPWLEGK